jgi:hypothetical protein
MWRRIALLPGLLTLGCGSARTEADPAPAAAATEETDPSNEARGEEAPPAPGALSIPDPWPARAPIVAELVTGELLEISQSWSIGMLGDDGLASLGVRSRPAEREAAYAAGCARLDDHDPRYSIARTSMSARVDDVSIRMAIPHFFPGQLDVQASFAVPPADVVARCSQLAPLADELAALEAWPAGIRDCERARRASESDWAHVRLAIEEGPALAWLRAHRFVENPSESSEVRGRVFERAGDVPTAARWYASRSELLILVGDEGSGLELED